MDKQTKDKAREKAKAIRGFFGYNPSFIDTKKINEKMAKVGD